MNALEIERVSRDFTTPDARSYRAIDEISLAVPAGAFVAIVGPSGCGKSTLLNVVAGLLPPSSGTVRVVGEALSGLNRHATYMFQQDALLPWKDVGRGLRRIQNRLKEMGSSFDKPIFALSFLPFVTLPALRITARGLIQVKDRRFVPLCVD